MNEMAIGQQVKKDHLLSALGTYGSLEDISKTIQNGLFYCYCEILSASEACTSCKKVGRQQVAKES